MSFLAKNCNLVIKKSNKYFDLRNFIIYSKLMNNKLGRCPTKSDNFYFTNNGKASPTVITAAFCFAYARHNLIIIT